MTALRGLHSTVACFVFITLRVAICEWPLIYSRHFCLRGTASILMAAALFLPFGTPARHSALAAPNWSAFVATWPAWPELCGVLIFSDFLTKRPLVGICLRLQQALPV